MLTVINLLVPFVLQVLVIKSVGVGLETDSLFISMSIPTFILSVTIGSIGNVLVPIFSVNNLKSKSDELVSVFLFMLVVSVAVTVALYSTIDIWLGLLTPTYTSEARFFVRVLIEIHLLGIPFYFILITQWSLLNSQKKHVESELTPTIFSLVVLPLMYFLIPMLGVYIIPIWFVVKGLVNNILLYLVLRRCDLNFELKSRPRLTHISNVWGKLKYLLLGASYYKSEPILDRYLLSSSNVGNLSVFVLTYQIYSALSQVLAKALVTPAIASMSRAYNNGDHQTVEVIFKKSFIKLFLILFLFLCLFFSFYFILPSKLLGSIFSNLKDEGYLTYAMLLLPFFIGGVLGTLTSGAFYSIGNTKYVSTLAVIMFSVYLPIKIVVYNIFGSFGLAIIISMYSVLSTLIIGSCFILYMKNAKKY